MENWLYGLAFLTGVFLAMGGMFVLWRERLNIHERLDQYTAKEKQETIFRELNLPLRERVLRPVLEQARLAARKAVPREKAQSFEQRLVVAGRPLGMDAQTFVIFRYVVLALMIGLGLLTRNFLLFLVCGALGVMLPDLYLSLHRAQRQERMVRSLPDVLDLLCVSVEAGLGFDAALQRVVQTIPGPLTEEIAAAMKEVSLGKPRRQALRDMAARIEVEDVSTFVTAVVQAESLGVPIANVLRIQADQARQRRRQRAEEQAHKAPVKMVLPLAFFIFPCIFIIVLGPAVIQMWDQFFR